MKSVASPLWLTEEHVFKLDVNHYLCVQTLPNTLIGWVGFGGIAARGRGLDVLMNWATEMWKGTQSDYWLSLVGFPPPPFSVFPGAGVGGQHGWLKGKGPVPQAQRACFQNNGMLSGYLQNLWIVGVFSIVWKRDWSKLLSRLNDDSTRYVE